VAAARSEFWKSEHKITHVLACLPWNVDSSPSDKRISVMDMCGVAIVKHFKETNEWIHQLRTTLPHARILVHCFAGISRSSTIVIAYLIDKHDFAFDNALYYVKEKRHCVNPNAGFKEQLRSYAEQKAVDRAFCVVEKNRRLKRMPKVAKQDALYRRILKIIWQYGEWHFLSDLKLVANSIFAIG